MIDAGAADGAGQPDKMLFGDPTMFLFGGIG